MTTRTQSRLAHAGRACWPPVLAFALSGAITACSDEPGGATAVQQPNPPSVAFKQAESVGLVAPIRIALGKPNTLFVSDYRLGLVLELKVRGDEVKIGKAFDVPGRPLGVAWTGNRLLVGNATTQSIDVFASTGEWLETLGGEGTVLDPTDIAVDVGAQLAFVVDGQAGTLNVYDVAAGALAYTVGQSGAGEFDFQSPTGVTVDPSRLEIVVADYGDPLSSSTPPAIKIFAYDGTPIQHIPGRSGFFGAGKFLRPQGVAVGPSGEIMVVDAVAGQVVIIDRQSTDVLERLSGAGTGPNDLWLPLDLVIDTDLNIFVTNNRLQRVQRFVAGGLAP